MLRKGVIKIGIISKVTVPANTPTVIVNGDEHRAWIQGRTFFIGKVL